MNRGCRKEQSSEVGEKLGECVWKRVKGEVLVPSVGFLLLSFGL